MSNLQKKQNLSSKIQAHLERIHYNGDLTPSLKLLNDLHRLSSFHIPFENFDVHLKGKVSLDKDEIFDKIIKQGRGGYCYELNGLFYDLLTELGFETTYLVARPMLGYTHTRPKTHMLLKVELDGNSYICDLGFTGMSVLEPLKLQLDTPVTQYHQEFKLVKADNNDYLLQAICHDNWVSLFSFDLSPQLYLDFELANFFNSHSDKSICVTSPIASIYTKNGRIRLINDSIKIRTEVKDIVDIHSAEQAADELKKYFNLSFSAAETELLFTKMKKQ